MKRYWLALGGIVLLTAAAQTPPRSASFDFNGVRFNLPIPDGYCFPAGAATEAIARVNAADDRNLTHLTLVTCGDRELAKDTIRIATSRAVLETVANREQVLAALAPVYAKTDFSTVMEHMGQKLSKELSTRIDLTGEVRPRGQNKNCAFMGGVGTVRTEQISYTQSVGGCITAVDDRILQIYSTGPGETPADVARRMLLAETVALSITGKPVPAL